MRDALVELKKTVKIKKQIACPGGIFACVR